MDPNIFFSDWHPHFTPRWLSERMVERLPREFSGAIVDPACGAGNLLAAAALRLGQAAETAPVQFFGMDVSARAVRSCNETLRNLLPKMRFSVSRGDFLRHEFSLTDREVPLAVIMNPPFGGYGQLSASTRRHVSKSLGMRGRFNLAYAFVSRALRILRPQLLVALLPSTWFHSAASRFRSELSSFCGEWEWEEIGDDAFKNVNAHVGILTWRSIAARKRRRRVVRAKAKRSLSDGIEVRHGAATGSDRSFVELSSIEMPFGRRMVAVRGRDIGRPSNNTIWVPMSDSSPEREHQFAKAVPRLILDRLARRSCINTRSRRVFEYHDSVPEWFCGHPKLLLPEIVSGAVRIEFDEAGKKFPLHSVIAVLVPSVAIGHDLKKFLERNLRGALMLNSPRLVGGAVRLQVPVVRRLAAKYQSRRLENSKPGLGNGRSPQ